MAGGKNIKTILPSWLLATGFSSRAGLGSAERLDLSSSTGLVEGRIGQVGIMKCHFGRVQRPALLFMKKIVVSAEGGRSMNSIYCLFLSHSLGPSVPHLPERLTSKGAALWPCPS